MPAESLGFGHRSLQTLFDTGSATGLSDRELLDQFLARRNGRDDHCAEGAFAAIVARHGPMVWGVCRSISPDSHRRRRLSGNLLIWFAKPPRSGGARRSAPGFTASRGASPSVPKPPSRGAADRKNRVQK